MNINPDEVYHTVEPVKVNARTAEEMLEKMCEMCGKPFKPVLPTARFCKDPECIKHRHVVRQIEFQRRHSSGRPAGRPRTIAEEDRDKHLRHYYYKKNGGVARKNGVAPENRSPQLAYYYKKKAGKVDAVEDKLKDI